MGSDLHKRVSFSSPYQSVMPTRSIQNPARPKPHEVTHTTPNSPACGGSPLLIPPHAGERKGAVMLSGSEASKIPPNQSPRSRQTPCPRSASANRDFRCAQGDKVRQGAGDLRALIPNHVKHHRPKSRMRPPSRVAFVDRGRTLGGRRQCRCPPSMSCLRCLTQPAEGCPHWRTHHLHGMHPPTGATEGFAPCPES